ncbi:MAG: flavodoxin-dependent (E)-4-hydroxy-3-methylbut-2-enyl-diphosphate synthase [Candidatus Hydrogenedens sp.]
MTKNVGIFHPRKKTYSVRVRNCFIGGEAPIVVQAMTNTNTEDAEATARQVADLFQAGAEIVRITVNTPLSAKSVPEIRKRLEDMGLDVPLVGDFHYNGHTLLSKYPECAQVLDKFRINPGNVGLKEKKTTHFLQICKIARDLNKPIRIGVNIGSLDADLVIKQMEINAKSTHPKTSSEIYDECMVLSALQSVDMAQKAGLKPEQIVISCKSSSPIQLIRVYRKLSERTQQPLHLGLTEAGSGMRGIVWSSTAMGILLSEGIGDTIRVSLTPSSVNDRREEVYSAQEILQSLGIRQFAPQVISCPGCGRTSNHTFQKIAEQVQKYIREHLHYWRKKYNGVEQMNIAVMGCIVNGPGESRFANIGISLPGNGEHPQCPVYIDGEKRTILSGDADELASQFIKLIEEYIHTHYL